MEFVNKTTGLSLHILKRKVKMNVCSIWPFAQISDGFYYLDFGNVPDICCSIIQGVRFNYHQGNVRSRISVSVSNFQVSVSVFMKKSRFRLEIWARSRSRRLLSRVHHCVISLCANELGLSIRNSETLWKWLCLSSRVIDYDSGWVILWKTWLESSHHFSQRDSSRVQVTKNRDSNRVIDPSRAITDVGYESNVLKIIKH